MAKNDNDGFAGLKQELEEVCNSFNALRMSHVLFVVSTVRVGHWLLLDCFYVLVA
jgi:hypothetical protein